MAAVFILFVFFMCGCFVNGKHDVNCMGQICRHNGCILTMHQGNLTGSCAADHHECDGPRECHRAEDVNHHEGCCCKDDHCLFTVQNPHHQVTCSDCPNVLHNDCHRYNVPCHDNEVCKIKRDHNTINTRCEERHKCSHEHDDDQQHNDPFKSTACCLTAQCTFESIHHSSLTTTTTAPITTTQTTTVQTTQPDSLSGSQCPTCTDGFIGLCTTPTNCTSGQSCMLQVRNGKLKSQCEDKSNCFLERALHGDTICCADTACVGNSFRNLHNAAFSCPTCQLAADGHQCLNSPKTCSAISQGCSILRNGAGFTAGCIDNYADCHTDEYQNSPLCHVTPIPFASFPNLSCKFCCHDSKTSCVLNALGITDGHSTIGKTVAKTTTSTTTTTTTTTTPTTTTAQEQCVDHDQFGNCKNLAASLCHSTEPSVHAFAVANCARTCNFCTSSLSAYAVVG